MCSASARACVRWQLHRKKKLRWSSSRPKKTREQTVELWCRHRTMRFCYVERWKWRIKMFSAKLFTSLQHMILLLLLFLCNFIYSPVSTCCVHRARKLARVSDNKLLLFRSFNLRRPWEMEDLNKKLKSKICEFLFCDRSNWNSESISINFLCFWKISIFLLSTIQHSLNAIKIYVHRD